MIEFIWDPRFKRSYPVCLTFPIKLVSVTFQRLIKLTKIDMKPQTELQILSFQTQKKWRGWILKNYSDLNGVWLRLYKKDSGIKSINHADEALDEALCFGWIDGQAKKNKKTIHSLAL